jgi:hypothetical protein
MVSVSCEAYSRGELALAPSWPLIALAQLSSWLHGIRARVRGTRAAASRRLSGKSVGFSPYVSCIRIPFSPMKITPPSLLSSTLSGRTSGRAG